MVKINSAEPFEEHLLNPLKAESIFASSFSYNSSIFLKMGKGIRSPSPNWIIDLRIKSKI